MRRYELVFIDADETLFDFRKAERFALERSFDQFGLILTESAARDYDEINRALWQQLEKGETDHARLRIERFRLLFSRLGAAVDVLAFGAAYVQWLSRASFLLEGAAEICGYLSRKYTLAIITNGIKDVQVPRLAASAIAKDIARIIVSEEAGSSKPDTGIFDYASRLLGFHDRSAMIMIGDSLSSDIQGGINYGIDTCWVNYGSVENPSALKPTYEIASLGELKNIL